MRRPAPLPNSPASAPEESVARSWGRTRTRTKTAAEATESPAELGDEPLEPEAPPSDAPVTPTTAGDVWSAARARRKALRAEIRRFTQRSRRRRIVWLSSIAAIAFLIGGSVLAAYSPLFAVEKITVVGAKTLDPAALEKALSDQVGTPLALVDSSEVKAALLAFPLIETYSLEARPPHDLTVRIVERTPVGVIRSDAGYTLVDAAGVALATTSAQPAGQPVITVDGGATGTAFESVGLVVRSLPAAIRASLTGVRATTADDVTLTLASGLKVVWGSAENSSRKAATLSAALAANPRASSIDVTSPDIAVIG